MEGGVRVVFAVLGIVFVGLPLLVLAVSLVRTSTAVLARRRAERVVAAPAPPPRPAAVSRPIGASVDAELKIPVRARVRG